MQCKSTRMAITLIYSTFHSLTCVNLLICTQLINIMTNKLDHILLLQLL